MNDGPLLVVFEPWASPNILSCFRNRDEGYQTCFGRAIDMGLLALGAHVYLWYKVGLDEVISGRFRVGEG